MPAVTTEPMALAEIDLAVDENLCAVGRRWLQRSGNCRRVPAVMEIPSRRDSQAECPGRLAVDNRHRRMLVRLTGHERESILAD